MRSPPWSRARPPGRPAHHLDAEPGHASTSTSSSGWKRPSDSAGGTQRYSRSAGGAPSRDRVEQGEVGGHLPGRVETAVEIVDQPPVGAQDSSTSRRYAAASMSARARRGRVISTTKIHPSPYGSEFTQLGRLVECRFTSTTPPDTGRRCRRPTSSTRPRRSVCAATTVGADVGELDEHHVTERVLREVGDADTGPVAVDGDPLVLGSQYFGDLLGNVHRPAESYAVSGAPGGSGGRTPGRAGGPRRRSPASAQTWVSGSSGSGSTSTQPSGRWIFTPSMRTQRLRVGPLDAARASPRPCAPTGVGTVSCARCTRGSVAHDRRQRPAVAARRSSSLARVASGVERRAGSRARCKPPSVRRRERDLLRRRDLHEAGVGDLRPDDLGAPSRRDAARPHGDATTGSAIRAPSVPRRRGSTSASSA